MFPFGRSFVIIIDYAPRTTDELFGQINVRRINVVENKKAVQEPQSVAIIRKHQPLIGAAVVNVIDLVICEFKPFTHCLSKPNEIKDDQGGNEYEPQRECAEFRTDFGVMGEGHIRNIYIINYRL